jgi:hypothetical protein
MERAETYLFVLYSPMCMRFNQDEDLEKIFSDSSNYIFLLYLTKKVMD